ncbi:MAG: hypothetical protein CMO55_25435 [Verrucomicrobiales bacterium]|nr:hypothetical protein [Verrucomicrobiales bacterium]
MLPGESNLVKVYAFSIGDDSDIRLGDALPCLNQEENDRAQSFRFDVHRERYVRSRGKLRTVLGECLGCSPNEVPLLIDEMGKPYLPDGEVHFNLSHSEDLAVVAVSRVPSIGVDVELFSREVDIDGLGNRCFRESEIKRMQSLGGDDKVRAFFWTWTAKEARMKATGEGFRLEPKRIEILFAGEYPRECVAPVEPSAHIQAVDLSHKNAACTVAALSPFTTELVTRS